METKLHKSCHDPPLNDRQSRWIESLTPFSYTFQWIPGQKNTVADALSRYPVQCNTVTMVHSLLAGLEHRIRLVAGEDQEYQRAKRLAEAGSLSWKIWQGLVVDDRERVLVPCDAEIRTLLISEAHDAPMAGHFGMDKTLELLQRYWTWKDLRKDVRDYVRSCISCQRIKHSTRKPPGHLHPIVARRPWQIVTMDFVGGLPPLSGSTSTQILVVVDKFSKYAILEPCPSTMTALDTAQAFIRRVVSSFGVPSVVISDRGPQFASKVWEAILQGLGSKAALASTHHPQTDGQSERAIQTLLRIVRSFVLDQAGHWEEQLPLFQFAMNNAATAVTGLSPFQVLYGSSPVAPLNWGSRNEDLPPGTIDMGANVTVMHWARQWWKARRKLHQFVQTKLHQASEVMKKQYDKGRKPLNLQEGDLVLVSVRSHSVEWICSSACFI